MVFNLRKEQRSIDQYIDIDIPATRIRRMLKLVRVAAGSAFNKQYGETNGFDFQIEGGSKDIDEDGTLMEIEAVIKGKNSITYNYKMTCDNGSAKYSALNFRSPRAGFINDMISFINSTTIKNKLDITEIKLHTLAGGKNPTLIVKSFYAYKAMDKKGNIVTKRTNINYNFSLKYAGKAESSSKLNSLKPKDITPLITDKWLTPQQFYNNVISFISNPSSNNIFTSSYLRDSYLEAVSNSWNNNSFDDKLGIAPDMSSEFFEVLSVLKISKLLSSNNADMKDIVGWPDKEKINKVEIYLPEAANEALIDYKIAVNGNTNTPLKISVKSQMRGSSTATVKFQTAFPGGEAEVHKWFKNIAANAKSSQIGQRMIASSAMEYNKYSGKGTLYPIRGLRKLLSGSKKSQVSSDFKKVLDVSSMTIQDWNKMITILDRKISGISKNYEPIDNLIQDQSLLLKTKNFIADNLFKENTKSKKVKECITMTIENATKNSPNKKYPFALNNIALLCERVLVQTSYAESQTQLNFYKLFYEQVLLKESVVYSITKQKEINSEVRLHYDFVSTRNFAQYKDWIKLRTKNYANNMQDALGMQT